MYKVLDYNSQKDGEKLIHSGNIFHEALEKKIEYCHVYRDGVPVVKIVVCNNTPVSKRVGVAKGKLKSPIDLDYYSDEIAEMFEGTLLKLCQSCRQS